MTLRISVMLFLVLMTISDLRAEAPATQGGDQQAIRLEQVYSTSGQKGLQHVGPELLPTWPVKSPTILGFVWADDFRQTLKTPLTPPPADPQKPLELARHDTQLWAVVYAGTTGSTPPQWLLDAITIRGGVIEIACRNAHSNEITDDLHPYAWWIPLDKSGGQVGQHTLRFTVDGKLAVEQKWSVIAGAPASQPALPTIHAAARRGDLEAVKALLKTDRDLVSSKDSGGKTPLHWAAYEGHIELVKLLLASKPAATQPAISSKPVEKDGLAVTVSLPKAVIAADEPLKFTVEFKNVSDKPFKLLNADGYHYRDWRIRFRKLGQGDWGEFGFDQAGKLKLTVVQVEPGRTLTVPIVLEGTDLTGVARILSGGKQEQLKPGKYLLAVKMDQRDNAENDPKPDVKYWAGPITTEPVEFEITEKPAATQPERTSP